MELAIKNQTGQITHLALRGRLDTAGVGEVDLKLPAIRSRGGSRFCWTCRTSLFSLLWAYGCSSPLLRRWIGVGPKRYC